MNIRPYTLLKLTRSFPLSLRSSLDDSLQNRHQHGCTGKSARSALTLFRTELAAALPLVLGDRVQLQHIRGGLDKASGADRGLSISGSIIESYGGRFRAAVNLPLGASFCFILPTQVEAHE
jgi:hypothetical protein